MEIYREAAAGEWVRVVAALRLLARGLRDQGWGGGLGGRGGRSG